LFYSTVATGAAGSSGVISGTSTEAVTGTTTGPGGATVYSRYSDGILGLHIDAGVAHAYTTATAGAGSVGSITGGSSVGLDGTTVGVGAFIQPYSSIGVLSTYIHAGNAYANGGNAKSVATSAASTVGAIAGTSTVTVTGKIAAATSVGASQVYGIKLLDAIAGYAYGYTATAKLSSIAATGGITGTATATVTGNSGGPAGTNSIIYAGRPGSGGIDGFAGSTLSAGVAIGSESKAGIATSAGGTIGAIKATASATSTETGTVETSSYGYVRGVSSLSVAAGDATGAAATAGAGTIGTVYGKASATEGSTIATMPVTVKAYGLYGITLAAGVATSTAPAGVATAGASGIGAITGEGYATATASSKVSTASAAAYADGIHNLAVTAGVASSPYQAFAATAGVQPIDSIATATAAGYSADASVISLDLAAIHLANAYGGGSAKSVTKAAAGTIASLTGSATATATAATGPSGSTSTHAYGLGYGPGTDVGTGTNTFNLGDASGYGAVGGAGSSVGKVSGTATSTDSGYSPTSLALGMDRNYFIAGQATGDGKVTAGSSSIGAGTGVYGSATANATSTATKGAGASVHGNAYGIYALRIRLSGAYSASSTTGDNAYGAAGQVGSLNGKATVTGAISVGGTITGDAYGLTNGGITNLPSPLIIAGEANGYGKATAGVGTVGNVYGLGKVDFTKAAAALTSTGRAYGIGSILRGVAIIAGYADATAAKGVAQGGIGSSIGTVYGKALGYSVADSKAGGATSTTGGIIDGTFTAGDANGNSATAGAAAIGKVTGFSKATAAGFSASATSRGMSSATFAAADAGTAAVGSVGAGTGVYGYAYASAQSAGGNSFAQAYGIENFTVNAGVGTTAGTGTVGTISGIGKAYALDSNKGTNNAGGLGLLDGDVNAGGTAAAIGKVIGYGTASNSAGKTTPTGADAYAAGIASFFVTSGGSIGAITGSAFQGSSNSPFPHINAGLYNSAFTAGTTIGIIKGTNTGTGDFTAGIYRAYVTAGTTIAGVYGKAASSDSNAISGSHFQAINTGGTGATSAIGYVTGVTGSATQNFGVGNSIFTTSGSIGAINVTGSVYGGGFFAGDLLNGASIGLVTGIAGANIGAVKISGYFISADLVASVTNSTSGYFGRDGDVSNGGTIASVKIGLPDPVIYFKPAIGENYAIEAQTFTGGVTWGGTPLVISPGIGSCVHDGGGTYVRVEEI
jgi:hypothetical protein